MRVQRKWYPTFSPLALAVCAVLKFEYGYSNFYHLGYLP